jgi:hypothetical protein
MSRLYPESLVPWILALVFALVLILGVSITAHSITVRALSKDVGECKAARVEEARRANQFAERIMRLENRERERAGAR